MHPEVKFRAGSWETDYSKKFYRGGVRGRPVSGLAGFTIIHVINKFIGVFTLRDPVVGLLEV